MMFQEEWKPEYARSIKVFSDLIIWYLSSSSPDFPLKRIYCSFICLGTGQIPILCERMSRWRFSWNSSHSTSQRVHIEKRAKRNVLFWQFFMPLLTRKCTSSHQVFMFSFWIYHWLHKDKVFQVALFCRISDGD